jgi:hypothetical protein
MNSGVTSKGLSVLAGLGLLAAVPAAATAADLGAGLWPSRSVVIEERMAVTLVPDCIEGHWARLVRCAPRQNVPLVDEVGLVQLLNTMEAPRRRPYPELVNQRR